MYQPFAFMASPAAGRNIPTDQLLMDFNGSTYSGTGNWIDDANGYELVIDGATYNSSTGVFEFDGSNDSMYLTTTNPFTGQDLRSICMWINPDAISGDVTMFTCGTNTTGQKYTFRYYQSQLRIEIAGGGYNSSLNEPANTWQFVAITYGGGTLGDNIIYAAAYNDTTVASDSATGGNGINTGTAAFALGANNYDTSPIQYFDGEIGDFITYEKELSSSEIQEVFDATKDKYQ